MAILQIVLQKQLLSNTIHSSAWQRVMQKEDKLCEFGD